MKTFLICVLALSLSSGTAFAGDISISLSMDDSRTEMGPRHAVRDARTAITSRDGSTVLLLLDDVVAVQLSDAALARLEERKDKKEPGFFEELLTAGVKLAVGKSVEYPIAGIRTVDYRDGALHLTTDRNEPVFKEVKVNGADVLKSFAPADAARFVKAFRAAKR